MTEKKPTKKPRKRATNTKKTGKIEKNKTISDELKELLEIFKNIPKDRRENLINKAKKEAAGDILTDDAISAEIKTIQPFFSDIKDPRKKKLITRKIEEVAFQAVLIRQAKESLITEGLQKEVVNGSQHYPKENPAVSIYDKNCRAYQNNIDKLIEYLQEKEIKAKSALAALRDDTLK